jgi:leader peptidase (prepilin peptidase)/N-methyltransferase
LGYDDLNDWYNPLDMNLILAILVGLAAGSLVNYVADVLPTQRKFTRPACIHCGAILSWRGYFLLQPCRECRKPRSWRTIIVLAMGPIIAVMLQLVPPAFGYWVGVLVLTYFGVVLVIDMEHRLIMHIVSLAGVAIGLLAGVITNGLARTLVGGLAGSGIMLVFYLFGMLFARYRARKLGLDDGEEALGFGDVTLSAVIGLMLGWPLVTTGLLIGILAGGLISLLLILVLMALHRYERMNVFTAYGPYLLLGATVIMFIPQAAHFFTGR